MCGPDDKWGHGVWGVYFDRNDRRLLVPKRNPRLGWTLNMAHRHAPTVMLAFTACAFVLVAAAGRFL